MIEIDVRHYFKIKLDKSSKLSVVAIRKWLDLSVYVKTQ